MKVKKIPYRTCAVTGEKLEKKDKENQKDENC